MAAPSLSWNTITVYGTYRKLDGAAHSGNVRFSVSERVVSNTDDVIFPPGSFFDVALDENGHVEVELPAVDDPDNSPSDWVIKVEEKLSAGGGASYNIQPRMDMDPSGLNLREVLITGGGVSTAALIKGVPGGVAALNENGDVLNADGQVVSLSDGAVTEEMLQPVFLRTIDAVVNWDGTGTQPLRSTATSDVLRRVRWAQPIQPPSTPGYAITGLDVWEKTS